jgi:hypothetical protein
VFPGPNGSAFLLLKPLNALQRVEQVVEGLDDALRLLLRGRVGDGEGERGRIGLPALYFSN